MSSLIIDIYCILLTTSLKIEKKGRYFCNACLTAATNTILVEAYSFGILQLPKFMCKDEGSKQNVADNQHLCQSAKKWRQNKEYKKIYQNWKKILQIVFHFDKRVKPWITTHYFWHITHRDWWLVGLGFMEGKLQGHHRPDTII